MRHRAVGLALGLGLVLAGCRAAPAPPNVVLIVIDTLRADRLGVYGDTRQLTPFLDQLASRAVVYHHAYAQSSWTNASIASLWTSRYQSQHGVIDFSSRLADGEQTLARALQTAGYATGCVSANILISRHLGFAQGYDMYWAEIPKGWSDTAFSGVLHRAATVNDTALAWLDGLPADKRARSFLHVQYMETHPPYDPPREVLAERFGRRDVKLDDLNAQALLAPLMPVSAATAAVITDVYDAEVISVDRGVRALFAALEQRGLLDNALVIVTADHGEQLMDHGKLGHRQSLYNEEIRVPLLVLPPGRTARLDVEQPVGLVDVAPTILAWAGVPPPASFAGRLLPGAAPPGTPAAAAAPRAVFSEMLPSPADEGKRLHERATVSGAEKLILSVDGSSELYDLARDPGERQRDGSPAAGLDLRAQLQDFRRLMARAAPADSVPLDAETKERLRALGYAH